MSHTPNSQGHHQHPQRKLTPNQPLHKTLGVDQTGDLTARMSQMSTGNQNSSSNPHAPGISHDQNIYNTGSIFRPIVDQNLHSTAPSLSFGSPMQPHLTSPQGGYGHQDFSVPYWAAIGGIGAQSNPGSAPPSAGPQMTMFGLPFTPTDPSPATATFPYGSTVDGAGNMVPGGNAMSQNGGGGGFDSFLGGGGQQQLQTAADVYATGQVTRQGGGFGLNSPPPPRGRGRYGGQQQNQPLQHHQHQQQHQSQNHQIGWSPHENLDGGMPNLGTGRLSDPDTNSYYGISGPGYQMNQGMYGSQPQTDRRRSVRTLLTIWNVCDK